MVERCRRIAESRAFQNGVLGLIVLNGVVMGLETWPDLAMRWAAPLGLFNIIVQAAFVLELVVRVTAFGRRPLAFFRSGWNSFDFAVVVLSLLPVTGSFAMVARLARILRAARLVTGLPELRLIVGTVLRSIPSMGHVVILLGLIMFVYGVAGHHLFGQVDPTHWGTLARALQTLFLVITLEGWVELMRASEAATPWAWVFYVTFIIVGVFVVINLFIAVVINNLEKTRNDELGGAPAGGAVGDDDARSAIRSLTAEVEKLRRVVESLRDRS